MLSESCTVRLVGGGDLASSRRVIDGCSTKGKKLGKVMQSHEIKSCDFWKVK